MIFGTSPPDSSHELCWQEIYALMQKISAAAHLLQQCVDKLRTAGESDDRLEQAVVTWFEDIKAGIDDDGRLEH